MNERTRRCLSRSPQCGRSPRFGPCRVESCEMDCVMLCVVYPFFRPPTDHIRIPTSRPALLAGLTTRPHPTTVRSGSVGVYRWPKFVASPSPTTTAHRSGDVSMPCCLWLYPESLDLPNPLRRSGHPPVLYSCSFGDASGFQILKPWSVVSYHVKRNPRDRCSHYTSTPNWDGLRSRGVAPSYLSSYCLWSLSVSKHTRI